MKKAFTLSEVLICLGIVGVVAALSIPSTMKNYQKRMLTAQLQKTYSKISSAAQTIMEVEHVDNFYDTTAISCVKGAGGDCTAGIKNWFDKYLLPVQTNCGANGTGECIAGTAADSYKTFNGSNAGTISQYCVQTADGAAICGLHNPNNVCLSMIVDVNSSAGPNILGRDVFSMDMHKDGSISDYQSGCADNNYGAAASLCTQGAAADGIFSLAAGCLTAIIEAGWKMEY